MNNHSNGIEEKDIWYRWLHGRRDGGDPERRKESLRGLAPIRDKVLEGVALKEDELLLDVGCGDGLIGLGALDSVPNCRVIFSDISADLLDYCRDVVTDAGCANRCRFELLSADNLHTIPDASVDAVTTRSVLIYVKEKAAAFREFHRVLKPGGRLSIFEPINRFGYSDRPTNYFGYDLSPVLDLYAKVRTAFRKNDGSNDEPADVMTDPMLDFDERDLMPLAEQAGFTRIFLDYQATIHPCAPGGWEHIFSAAPNPNAPSLEEAVLRTLTPPEREEFVACLKPLVERGEGTRKFAAAFLRAIK